MASAWGSSWGSAWGASWGVIPPATVQSGSSGGSGSGSRWWEEGQYRTQRKARQWTEEELNDLVEAAFLALGIDWAEPLTAQMRKAVRKYVEARSHEMNVLLSSTTNVTAAIDRREGENADLRAEDEEDTLLLLTA